MDLKNRQFKLDDPVYSSRHLVYTIRIWYMQVKCDSCMSILNAHDFLEKAIKCVS